MFNGKEKARIIALGDELDTLRIAHAQAAKVLTETAADSDRQRQVVLVQLVLGV